jgi:malate synthase
MSTTVGVDGLEVSGPTEDRFDEVLTPRALELVALLRRELDGRRLERLTARQGRVRAPFPEMAVSDEYSDSLTLSAYERTS